MGTLMVLTPGGGCRYYGWSAGDAETAGHARAVFERHRRLGYAAYELVDERRGSFVANFNAAASLIVMHRADGGANGAHASFEACSSSSCTEPSQ